MGKPYVIYGIQKKGNNRIIYVGCTNNLKKRQESLTCKHPVIKGLNGKIWWRILDEARDKKSAHKREMEIIVSQKSRGGCELNLMPKVTPNFPRTKQTMSLFTIEKCSQCNGKGKVRAVVPLALRKLRQKRGLTLAQFGKKIGFSKMYLSDIETGRRRATNEIVQAYQKL